MPRRPPPPSERLLTINQVAERWGCHHVTVRRAIAAGRLRAYRLPGGRLRVDAYDAERALSLADPETVSA
jgi:excisionase family DNA binding protein